MNEKFSYHGPRSFANQPQVYSGLNSPLPKKRKPRSKSAPKQFHVVDFRGEELFRGTLEEISREFDLALDTVRKKASTKHKINGLYLIKRINTEKP